MLTELKREAYEANIALPKHGLINLTFGNASAIDRAKGIFAIKPSGVAYADLKPADMVLIDLEGKKVEGKLNPSSDTPTHRRLFLAFEGIGGKEDPVRLVFNAPAGEALNASLVDLGNRYRLIVNEVKAVKTPKLPKLPVARAVWECKPDFKTACAAWIYAGGAHHTGYSYSVTTEMLEDFATIAGIETVVINDDTTLPQLKQDLRNNEVYYHLAQGFRV